VQDEDEEGREGGREGRREQQLPATSKVKELANKRKKKKGRSSRNRDSTHTPQPHFPKGNELV